jgi:signal transduction histidine kinase
VIGPFRPLSLRARLTAIGVLGFAGALAIGGIVLYGSLTYFVDRTLKNDGTATAREVATLVNEDRLPDPIPVSGTQVVQVLDDRNRVVSASVNGDRLTALLVPEEVSRANAGETVTIPGSRAGLAVPLRVVTATARDQGAKRTVVVAQEYGALSHSRAVLRKALLVTDPLVLLAVGLIAWWVIGRTLRPVEALRSAADRVSGTGQDTLLPVPDSHDEIRDLAVTLNSMLERLASSRAQQRAFVADAAHELRSPFASMLTQLEVAHRLGERSELTEGLLAEVIRVSGLVEDLLLLARSEAAPPPVLAPFEIRPLLDELARRNAEARVPVVVGAGARTAVATGNVDEVRRVLANLVDNAVRHASRRVELEVSSDGRWVQVSVSDDGPGIAEGDRGRVFERFTRLDDARDRDTGGSGLGLAIAQDLARRSGGSVSLRDNPGGGLRAELRLPR